MKPPTRTTRSTKSGAQWLKRKPNLKTKTNQDSNSDKKWQPGEVKNILTALRQQYKCGLDDIDTHALQERVPKRSVQEVESLLKSLKQSVAKKVFYQLKKQRKNEQEQMTPIQVWTELMERIAGSHEEKMSSAFSRMLVIAGTEPCNLKHSDPPRDFETPSSATTRVQPISRFFTIGSRLKSGAQMSSTADAQRLSGNGGVSNPNVSHQDKDNHLLSMPSLSSSMSTKTVVSGGSSSITGAIPSPSAAQRTQTTAVIENAQSSIIQNNSVPSDLSTTSSSSTSSRLSQQTGNNQGGNSSQGNPSQSDRAENTVDFEKIHTFLSAATKKDSKCSLTAMESAVVLDLIMSLPEELPLLDCQSLQDHFLQVYSRLTTPVIKTSSGIETEEPTDVPQAAKMNLNWENVGICPLNPLVVPLSLLTRKSDKDS
ncbi:snRNA-activating protein complex subunit 2 [Alosa sapidissima]|uniref:snRNA-activating protein complex subunit 2 n=1 Tax=Alosa sapidissima TaxID=34773 RepID=UPI001C0A447B|nr:snRNA-activating protein complex subunit 2 [Alosa sapidissima]XP_041926989.1 snRNA-activating protein complex subunit 2 [Alosa sapidissima]